MDEVNKLPTDFFMHIPRSGGSSMRTLLTLNYAGEEKVALSGAFHELDWFLTRPREIRSSYRLVHGHYPFGLHAGLDNFRYFTLIREPIARHFSEYFYARKYAHHHAHERIKTGELTLDYWAEVGEHHAFYHNNSLCQFLSREFHLSKPSHAMLQAACSNLEKMHVFGLTERFTESALMISKYMDWQYPVYGKRNVVMGNKSLPESVLSKARKLQEWDIGLYEYACEIFEKRIQNEAKRFFPALEPYKEKILQAQSNQESDSIRTVNRLLHPFFELFSVTLQPLHKVGGQFHVDVC